MNTERRHWSAPTNHPKYPEDCFRLAVRKPGNMINLFHGELLADAKYLLCLNGSGTTQEFTGQQLIGVFNSVFGSLFIPWVLARCTIIPL